MDTLALPPGVNRPWMQAMEAQLVAVKVAKWLEESGVNTNPHSWRIDEMILRNAIPFSWSIETVMAVQAAMRSIPLDTRLDEWNLNTAAAWWHFDEPLPYQTISDPEPGIRAISVGWIHIPRERVVYPAGTPQWMVNAALEHGPHTRGLAFSAWLDDPKKKRLIIPSQTMLWAEGATLGEHLEWTRREHIRTYGPGGPFADQPQVGVDIFMAAAEGMARFLLAGLAWLNQRVVVQSDGHIERHRRKDFNRTTGQQLEAVKVVHLRRMERVEEPLSTNITDDKKRKLTCQFTVDGHWRHQACGSKRGDRKLTWIHPFLKGPEGAPLRVPKHKVYVVNR